jgi:hypothetical protein
MRTRLGLAFAMAFAAALAGCGGMDEATKNEGTIVNTPPTSAGSPGGAAPRGGTPVTGGATNEVKPPPIPPINE